MLHRDRVSRDSRRHRNNERRPREVRKFLTAAVRFLAHQETLFTSCVCNTSVVPVPPANHCLREATCVVLVGIRQHACIRPESHITPGISTRLKKKKKKKKFSVCRQVVLGFSRLELSYIDDIGNLRGRSISRRVTLAIDRRCSGFPISYPDALPIVGILSVNEPWARRGRRSRARISIVIPSKGARLRRCAAASSVFKIVYKYMLHLIRNLIHGKPFSRATTFRLRSYAAFDERMLTCYDFNRAQTYIAISFLSLKHSSLFILQLLCLCARFAISLSLSLSLCPLFRLSSTSSTTNARFVSFFFLIRFSLRYLFLSFLFPAMHLPEHTGQHWSFCHAFNDPQQPFCCLLSPAAFSSSL
ncbi:hypothetical protein PUN28_004871 [Cardiocondyla obscurior]|uniref:Uncharacterized protein n=1 Tax=Cardiocondyla obscurior TaxID=286306 RepID=A0AAW2GGT8_9HYME